MHSKSTWKLMVTSILLISLSYVAGYQHGVLSSHKTAAMASEQTPRRWGTPLSRPKLGTGATGTLTGP